MDGVAEAAAGLVGRNLFFHLTEGIGPSFRTGTAPLPPMSRMAWVGGRGRGGEGVFFKYAPPAAAPPPPGLHPPKRAEGAVSR